MRVDIITKEYPPEIYGGAGVHVTELVKALRQSIDVQVRAFGAERDEAGHDGLRRARRARLRERRDPDPRHGSCDRDGCRGRRRGAQPHLVRELRRTPRVAAARHPAHRDRAQSRAAAAVEGRAARRRVRGVELHREDGLRGCRRDRGGQRGHARRHPAQLPDAGPRQGARDLQRHRRRGVASRRGSGAARASWASTHPSPRSSSSVASPGRRACRICCVLPSCCRPTSSSCCARGRRTPRRSWPRWKGS